jgi:outer membrane protein assembly factor BamB
MRTLFLLPLLSVLSACTWFEKAANPPLEGERIAILKPADITKANSGSTITLGAPQVIGAWPQANGQITQNSLHANFVPKFDRKWDTNIGDGFSDRKRITARPVAAEGKIFAMDQSGNVSALNAETGSRIWRMRTRQYNSSVLSGGIAYHNNVLYVANGLQKVFALSAVNGGSLWSADLGAPTRSAPVVDNGKLYVVTRAGQAFALDAMTGKIMWQHRGLLETAGVLSGAAPAINNEMVIVPYASGEVFALAASNGSVLWSENLIAARAGNNLATLRDLRAPPILMDDIMIAANYASIITAVEPRLGEQKWSHDFGVVQPMVMSGNAIFLISTNGQLLALDKDSGDIIWSESLQSKEHEAGDPQEYWYGPLLFGDQLFVISADGTGILRDAKTGVVTQTIEDLPEPAENPIVLNSMIYWVTASGDVVAYQ